MSYILLKQEQVTGRLKAAMKHVKAKSEKRNWRGRQAQSKL
jgi:hypothetical protein